jgi:hypothetical protein
MMARLWLPLVFAGLPGLVWSEPSIRVTVSNPQEPTLSALLDEALSACWRSAVDGIVSIELVVTLGPAGVAADMGRSVRISAPSLAAASVALSDLDQGLAECPLGALTDLASRLPAEGLRFSAHFQSVVLDDDAEDAIRQGLLCAFLDQPTDHPECPLAGLTQAESDAFRLVVRGCWAYDADSDAAGVTVTIGFELDPQGRVVANAVRLIGGSGGSEAAIEMAYQSARRAVLRCQGTDGYQLPPDKYEQWREVEMTFDPSGVR